MMKNREMKQTIGSRILSLRRNADYSQETLAELADISVVYLRNIEYGRENPSLDVLLALSKALKVELWELLCMDGQKF